tara:strand:- start:389 stop:862 length:474 start_codon:yes stop_codon:yes gene_type:complete
MKCLFVSSLNVPKSFTWLGNKVKKDDAVCLLPELTMSFAEQKAFDPDNYQQDWVVTNSPLIVSCFRRNDVFVYQDSGELVPVRFETYGASFDVLLKSLNGFKSLLPDKVVAEVREMLTKGDIEALAFIERLGDSGEKAYLKRKLLSEAEPKEGSIKE